jgi:hypothetical protein
MVEKKKKVELCGNMSKPIPFTPSPTRRLLSRRDLFGKYMKQTILSIDTCIARKDIINKEKETNSTHK